MKIRSKEFVAACDFTYGSTKYAAGDPIPAGRVLANLLRHGDRFAVADKRPSADPTPTTEENPDG